MSKVLEAARNVKARLEQGWCQSAFARTAAGESCGERSQDACSWCISGAMSLELNIAAPTEYNLYLTLRGALNEAIAGETGRHDVSVTRYNDWPGRTKEEVLSLVDRAIAKLENVA